MLSKARPWFYRVLVRTDFLTLTDSLWFGEKRWTYIINCTLEQRSLPEFSSCMFYYILNVYLRDYVLRPKVFTKFKIEKTKIVLFFKQSSFYYLIEHNTALLFASCLYICLPLFRLFAFSSPESLETKHPRVRRIQNCSREGPFSNGR